MPKQLRNLKISARQSDLARLQAYRVGQALKSAGIEGISYEFSTSLGDQNADDPLWKMPEKGVFTADFTRALIDRTTDMVVHSWKDLPTEISPETMIAATLPRADSRDLLLFKKSAMDAAKIQVLSSSPRRAHNLAEFLTWALPSQPKSVEFLNVRGNVQTRVRKLIEGESHGLIVAKAAMDRLLSAPEPEFEETKVQLRSALRECHFMVLPHSVSPAAAAQGALAVEIRRDRRDLVEILNKINCAVTFGDVVKEREILRRYGGGCHQKIGITCLSRPYGQVRFLRGVTDAGVILDAAVITGEKQIPQASAEKIFPLEMWDVQFYEREDLNNEPKELQALASRPHLIWISRADALTEKVTAACDFHPGTIFWTAGVKTWRKLAARGIWVSGCADNLGEDESPGVDTLVGAQLPSVKLSHSEAPEKNIPLIPTYHLRDVHEIPDLQGKTHFYWTSFSVFERALRRYPEIRDGTHACGPGHTFQRLREVLGPHASIYLFVSYKEWRDAVLVKD